MNRKIIHKLATNSWKLRHEGLQALRANLAAIDGQLQDLIALLRGILSDENFITLLRAEGLITIPSCVTSPGFTNTISLREARPEARPPDVHSKRALRQAEAALSEQMKERQRPLLDDLLDLTACVAYTEGLFGNVRISKYLGKNHAASLRQINQLIAMIRKPAAESEEGTMMVWSIARAKVELCEVVKQAKTNGPQLIRARRDPVVMVVSIRRWNAMLRRHPGLEEFFRQKTIRYSTKTIQNRQKLEALNLSASARRRETTRGKQN